MLHKEFNNELRAYPTHQAVQTIGSTANNLHGFKMSDVSISFFKLLYEHGSNIGFFLFDNRKLGTYKYIGPFDYEDPKLAILHTKILIGGKIKKCVNE